MKPKTVLVVMRMGEGNAVTHIAPLVRSIDVGHVHLVRETRLPLDSPKLSVHGPGRRRRLPPLLALLRAGLSVIRREPVDAVLGFFLVPYGLIAWLLGKVARRPVVLSLVGSDFAVHGHAWYAPLLRAVLRDCDAVTVTGQSMLQVVAGWGVPTERLHVLPNAIDTDRFEAGPSLADRRYDAVFVGRLVRLKRVDLLLRAFARIRHVHPEARFAIAGDGPERESLESVANTLGLSDAVEFHGYRPDVERLLADARIVTMCSEREGLPLALIEGMCSGCVPVSTRVGSIDDLIDHGRNGLLVDSGDWQALARHAAQLLSNPIELQRMSDSALGVRARYEWGMATDTWHEILGNL